VSLVLGVKSSGVKPREFPRVSLLGSNASPFSVQSQHPNDFHAFRVLWNSVPFTDEATDLVMDCLNFYVQRSGKPLATVERALALYKLKATEKLLEEKRR
jgi:hypothetical protein